MATFPVADSSEETTAAEVDRGAMLKRKSGVNGSNAPKIKRPRKEKASGSKTPVYEVEQVVGHNVNKKKQHVYLVKWQGWSSDDNTWEPSHHLDGCEDALFSFLDSFTSEYNFCDLDYRTLKGEVSQCRITDLNKCLKDYVTAKGISIPPPDYDKTDERLRIVSKWPVAARDPNVVEMLRRSIIEIKLYEKRQIQLDELKEWEREMNSIISSSNSSPITVVNNVDLEGPPENFIYINDYLPGERVSIPEDPPVGCSCEPNCSAFKRKCCPTIAGSSFAYDKEGRIRVPHGTPIYECNKQCKCGPDCTNRIVQKGRTVRLCIFRTSSGCGWGVKALENIPKGAFVSEYVGEVITFEEAEKRGKKYDKEGQTYLFDLDFDDTNAFPFTVDAAVYGNVSHFVNHSCDPNMTVYAVWGNCLDPNLPKLALFANKEIKQGDEISFDYLNQGKKNKDQINGVTTNGIVSTNYNMVCKCGSKKCRKFYL